MSFEPYIHFQGNCEEAMRFYADLFGTEPPFLMRYGDMPEASEGMSDNGKARIMHALIKLGDGALMASDWPEGRDRPQSSVSISHVSDSREAAKAIFERLMDGAEEVMMPFDDTFWADGFGMLRDRFGTAWMINGPSKM
ncbi:hypothetical protein B6V73_13380 [Thioclava sp. JM3]|uniref:VOC family protein n=1 Tax=Thioclava sp. JM3 TaxID=1973004 RepID=UPI000B54255B|nr:VOC family protein [Thioclava sp. JM3]OWY16169.1 hypothetical protein B6V73_13380 [Thioclava sp. JM3]